MKRFLLASVAALGLAGTASAADLAVKAPPLAPVFTWTGCYLGVNGGWIGGNNKYDVTRPFALTNAVPDIDATAADLALWNHSLSSNDSGGTAGGQAGCQYQWGWFVLGAEWDAAWTSLTDSQTLNVPATNFISNPALSWPAHQDQIQGQLNWFSTARVRLGATWWDRVLVYGTAGLAIGDVESFTNAQALLPGGGLNPAGPAFFGSYRLQRIGWTAGGGFEWAMTNNWIAKAEFLYLNFGSFDYTSTVQPTFTVGVDQRVLNTHVSASDYIVRVGLNYLFHFGPDAFPVVARY